MLEYIALGMLLLSGTAIFYIFIYIHDLPHRYAKKRNHPQAEAIHYACWLSLFTLHAIWPLVFIWAVSNTSTAKTVANSDSRDCDDVKRMQEKLLALESRLDQLEDKGSNHA